MDSQGFNSLHYAVVSGSLKLVKLLMKNSADLNTTCAHDWTPLMLSVMYSDFGMVEYISQSAKIDEQSERGVSALMLACHRGTPPSDEKNSDLYLFQTNPFAASILKVAEKSYMDKDGVPLRPIGTWDNSKGLYAEFDTFRCTFAGICVGTRDPEIVRCLIQKGANSELKDQVLVFSMFTLTHVAEWSQCAGFCHAQRT